MARTTTAQRVDAEARRVHKVYEALARFYDAGFDWALGPGRQAAIERLPLKPGDRVLEVGVGTGLSLPLYPAGCQVTGIDISPSMLERAEERVDGGVDAEIDLRVMDAREIAFPDGTFDCVLAPYVMSVVPEPRRVMNEIGRVCKVGGTAMVVNHFGSDNRLVRLGERVLSPMSSWIGFRLDLPIETVTRIEALETIRLDRVNLLGLWRLIEMRRRAQ